MNIPEKAQEEEDMNDLSFKEDDFYDAPGIYKSK